MPGTTLQRRNDELFAQLPYREKMMILRDIGAFQNPLFFKYYAKQLPYTYGLTPEQTRGYDLATMAAPRQIGDSQRHRDTDALANAAERFLQQQLRELQAYDLQLQKQDEDRRYVLEKRAREREDHLRKNQRKISEELVFPLVKRYAKENGIELDPFSGDTQLQNIAKSAAAIANYYNVQPETAVKYAISGNLPTNKEVPDNSINVEQPIPAYPQNNYHNHQLEKPATTENILASGSVNDAINGALSVINTTPASEDPNVEQLNEWKRRKEEGSRWEQAARRIQNELNRDGQNRREQERLRKEGPPPPVPGRTETETNHEPTYRRTPPAQSVPGVLPDPSTMPSETARTMYRLKPEVEQPEPSSFLTPEAVGATYRRAPVPTAETAETLPAFAPAFYRRLGTQLAYRNTPAGARYYLTTPDGEEFTAPISPESLSYPAIRFDNSGRALMPADGASVPFSGLPPEARRYIREGFDRATQHYKMQRENPGSYDYARYKKEDEKDATEEQQAGFDSAYYLQPLDNPNLSDFDRKYIANYQKYAAMYDNEPAVDAAAEYRKRLEERDRRTRELRNGTFSYTRS